MSFRTATEMYNYAKDHHFTFGYTEKMAKKHFAIIEKNLEPDEECEIAFIGMNNYRGRRTQQEYTAFAMTNKRMMIAQKKRFNDAFTSIYYYHLNRIYYEDSALLGVMTIDSVSGMFHIGITKERCKEIIAMCNELSDRYRIVPGAVPAATAKPVAEAPAHDAASDVEQILEYKKLLDAGVLSEEEFAAIKKKILGI